MDATAIDRAFQKHAGLFGTAMVGDRIDSERSPKGVNWYPFNPSLLATHHLRVVMPHEIVFDLGDDGDWPNCVEETEALWAALDRMAIPHWRALSGGKGTHTHAFGDPLTGAAQRASPSANRHIALPIYANEKDAVAEAPPCIQGIVRNLSAGAPVNHEGRRSVASYFLQLGFAPTGVAQLFVRQGNFNSTTTARQIASLNGHVPDNCQGLMAAGHCPGKCRPNINNPISYPGRTAVVEDYDSPPQEKAVSLDWRPAAAGSILEVASEILGRDLTPDWRLLSPHADARLCREFGRRKSPVASWCKTVWPGGPLPKSRPGAYQVAMAGPIYPGPVPITPWLHRLDRRWAGAGCPKGPQCIPGSSSCHTEIEVGCADCPLKSRLSTEALHALQA